MLALIAIATVASALVCSVAFVRRAPAVSAALVGFVAVGALGFYVSADDRPRGVPEEVAIWASCGLGAGGLLALAFTSPRSSATSLRRSARWFLALTPLVAGTQAAALLYACPLYVTEGARYCYHSADVLGGWITRVTALVVLDMFLLVVVCLASARAAPSAGEDAKVGFILDRVF